MQRIYRCLIIGALALGFMLPPSANASSRSTASDFCFKYGDYYDSDGTGWHVFHCYYDDGGFEAIYIRHGSEHLIYVT